MRIAKRQGIAVVLALLLAGAGCSGGGGSKSASGSTPKAPTGLNDIVPTDRADMADGGKLTWPIDTFPVNFNLNELDGALADGAVIMGAIMPGMFNIDAQGHPSVNPDYLTSAVLTATQPKQVVTYKVNPKAAWEDGTPITEADFEAQWKTMSGKNHAFQIVTSTGYENIESVAKGADDHEVVVTFVDPFADWQGLFSPLYPASTDTDPQDLQRGLEGPGAHQRRPVQDDGRRHHRPRRSRSSATRSGGASRPSSTRSSSARSTATPSPTPSPTAKSTSWGSAPTSTG